jgi:hypothetical protein
LSVISASGCETIVMNQTALKNSDQNVSQQIQNIASYSRDAAGPSRLIRCFRMADALNTTTREIGPSVPDFGLRAIRRLFLQFFVMALFPYPGLPERNAHRSIGMRASFTQAFIKVT